MFKLKTDTASGWLDAVLTDFDTFLNDHAAAEKKASGMAMSMTLHYPDKPDVVRAMIDLAIEELMHFREVVKLMASRNLQLLPDRKDAYINQLNKLARKGSDYYFLDRLLLGAVIEARGAERFGLIAQAVTDPLLKSFYQAIAGSEDKHQALFIDLAENHFPSQHVRERLEELLLAEAAILKSLPFRAALH